MDTKKRCLFICLVIACSAMPALGEVGYPWGTEHTELTLLGKANPALAGIKQLYVFIVPTGGDPNENDLLFKQLDLEVKNRVKQAGIDVAAVIYLGKPIQNSDMPELKINIEMLKLKKMQRCSFRIQTILSKKMYLEERSPWFIKADVWKSPSVMQTLLIRNCPAAITKTVLQQTDAFIQAYIAANPGSSKAADANEMKAISKTKLSQRPRQTQMPQTAQYQYVASKRSRVFHKPGCSSAARITTKNLTGFNSRQEATNSGKRPCKRCKP